MKLQAVNLIMAHQIGDKMAPLIVHPPGLGNRAHDPIMHINQCTTILANPPAYRHTLTVKQASGHFDAPAIEFIDTWLHSADSPCCCLKLSIALGADDASSLSSALAFEVVRKQAAKASRRWALRCSG
jgi:hypothetical protein